VPRPMTADEYERLWQVGVLGEKVELIAGRIAFGRYPFVLSAEAVADARDAGIELAPPAEAPPTAPSDAPFLTPETTAGVRARQQWQVLERVMLVLVQDGGADLTMAASWCRSEDEALGGLSPAAWLQFGRDPERLFELARQDAARLRQ
jgi:hypothetical protein